MHVQQGKAVAGSIDLYEIHEALCATPGKGYTCALIWTGRGGQSVRKDIVDVRDLQRIMGSCPLRKP